MRLDDERIGMGMRAGGRGGGGYWEARGGGKDMRGMEQVYDREGVHIVEGRVKGVLGLGRGAWEGYETGEGGEGYMHSEGSDAGGG